MPPYGAQAQQRDVLDLSPTIMRDALLAAESIFNPQEALGAGRDTLALVEDVDRATAAARDEVTAPLEALMAQIVAAMEALRANVDAGTEQAEAELSSQMTNIGAMLAMAQTASLSSLKAMAASMPSTASTVTSGVQSAAKSADMQTKIAYAEMTAEDIRGLSIKEIGQITAEDIAGMDEEQLEALDAGINAHLDDIQAKIEAEFDEKIREAKERGDEAEAARLEAQKEAYRRTQQEQKERGDTAGRANGSQETAGDLGMDQEQQDAGQLVRPSLLLRTAQRHPELSSAEIEAKVERQIREYKEGYAEISENIATDEMVAQGAKDRENEQLAMQQARANGPAEAQGQTVERQSIIQENGEQRGTQATTTSFGVPQAQPSVQEDATQVAEQAQSPQATAPMFGVPQAQNAGPSEAVTTAAQEVGRQFAESGVTMAESGEGAEQEQTNTPQLASLTQQRASADLGMVT